MSSPVAEAVVESGKVKQNLIAGLIDGNSLFEAELAVTLRMVVGLREVHGNGSFEQLAAALEEVAEQFRVLTTIAATMSVLEFIGTSEK